MDGWVQSGRIYAEQLGRIYAVQLGRIYTVQLGRIYTVQLIDMVRFNNIPLIKTSMIINNIKICINCFIFNM